MEHPPAETVKVRPAIAIGCNQLTVKLHVRRRRLGELRKEWRHVPAAPERTEVVMRAYEAAEAVLRPLTVERTGARRVLIDSLSDLQLASPDPIRFREYMYSLSQRLARSGVGLFMTAELPDLFQTTRLTDDGVSHLADNVVLLEYIRENATVRRTLTVLKTRARRHQPEVREHTISREGIVLNPTEAPDSTG